MATLAQLVVCMTLDTGVVMFSSMLGTELTLNKKN